MIKIASTIKKNAKKKLRARVPTFETINIKEEAKEFFKIKKTKRSTASDKLFGKTTSKRQDKQQKISPIVEAMLQTSEEHEEAKSISGAQRIESEITEQRKRRKEREDQWKKDQDELMSKDKQSEEKSEGPLLPSSPQKGPKGFGSGKQKSMETRKSKH